MERRNKGGRGGVVSCMAVTTEGKGRAEQRKYALMVVEPRVTSKTGLPRVFDFGAVCSTSTSTREAERHRERQKEIREVDR